MPWGPTPCSPSREDVRGTISAPCSIACHAHRGVETVMEKEEFTLEDLLSQEEIVQDVRGYNEALIE